MSARPFVLVDCEQRSEQWHTARLGRLTSSCAADMLAQTKSGEAAGRRNLRIRLALERLTGRSQETGFVSHAMQDGIAREPDALRLYEALTGQLVTQTGFLAHPELAAGASLDGHLGDVEGIVECKSPLAATHLEYLKTGIVPAHYGKQILHALWISGAAWCDWLSYHPEFPAGLRVKLVRVVRNEQEIAAYALAASLFLSEVQAELEAVYALREGTVAA